MATMNRDENANANGNGGETPLPIIIAGGGCVGLFLALLLCQSEIPNKVIVIEPTTPNPSDTRTMAHQPLIFPLFAQASLLPLLSAHGTFSKGLCFRKSVRNTSTLIAGKVFQEGEKAQLLLPQGVFQKVLGEKVQESDKGEVWVGKRVVGFRQIGDEEEGEGYVDVTVQSESSKENHHLKALYLLGADGAHSLVRKTLNFAFPGETLPVQLVATDLVFDFHAHGFYDANFVIDPQDYGLIGRINNEGLWRVSYGVPAGMNTEEIERGAREKLDRMVPGEGEGRYEVKRIAPYKAQQRCVERFWKGRVGVLGDAAHLTNPYAGLGLASGIADASSLASILIRILTAASASTSPPKLLTSWSESRREKFLNVVDKPSRMAYARVRTKVDTDEELEALIQRDPLMKGLKSGMPVMPPSLVTEVEGLEGW
ncbi:monooxygenase [Amniculicola lignicola CBS 123094]|uniref:Monooxygenase n=1 Tax=Amniculicola lignicola CBS 123094 TaxID=1392246 RepID=A0A6A5WL02_9PLEO|nr:monooxygenase [Amniculicola lignicola CBS 123094]